MKKPPDGLTICAKVNFIGGGWREASLIQFNLLLPPIVKQMGNKLPAGLAQPVRVEKGL
ncbi:MAG: hypothetical protein HQL82_10890 [Magnetococcales bacterium]|nr:hypothetical protein [Magnetococcales bacterium]